MDRQKWLEERRNHIGASEVAAILGVDPRRGPLAVYEAKTTEHSMKDSAWLKYGRDVEGAIANMYEHETGRKVQDLGATQFQFHPDFPWLAATLDRVVTFEDEQQGPLELKSVDPWGAKTNPKEWKVEPPIQYVVQLQMQMACTCSEKGSLAALFPGYQLSWLDIDIDNDLLELAFPVLKEFWERVEQRDPPPPDELPATNDVIKRLYPKDSGETIVLPTEALEIVQLWKQKKKESTEINKEIKALDSQLRDFLKDATFGALPDGTFLSAKTVEKKGYTVEVKPSSYRTLRHTKSQK